MDAIIVVIIAVCGWIVIIFIAVLGWIATHILTIRAQNKAFLNQIINEARLQIIGAIRDYQDWLDEVSNAICGINVDIFFQERTALGKVVHNWQKHTKFSELFFSDRRSDEWMFRLIEHRILFPKIDGCLDDLAPRQEQITKSLSSFLEEPPSGFEKPPDLKNRKKAIEKTQNNCIGILVSQDALMWDLRNYLQNLCLSSVTGNRVPTRKAGKSPEVLVEDERGNLRVVTAKATMKQEKRTEVDDE